MKDKIVAVLSNVLYELIGALICFVLAAIDAVPNHASSYADLSEFGKICTIIMMTLFGLMVIERGLIPIGYWILKGLKIIK